jgi:hypothetical protein
VTVPSRALSAERAARRDQHRRTELERPAQEASIASALLAVDDEFVGGQRIRKWHVSEQIALAEELDAIALEVLGV